MNEFKPEVEHGIVYRAHENTVFNYNGWPSVCRDDRGVLYAAASSLRMSHVDPVGKDCMWVSFNEGKTWTPPVVVHDDYFDNRDAGIISLGGGKMVLSYFSLSYEDFCEPMLSYDWLQPTCKAITKGFGDMLRALPEEIRTNGAYVKTSDDYGVTWSDPIKVPLTAPHGPSVCKDGTLVYMGKAMDPDYLADNQIVVYTSKDSGNTWEYTGTVPPGDDIEVHNMHEPHVIELPNGRLLGAIRIHERKTQPDFTVYITHSDDKGKTWSKPFCMEVDGSPPHLMVHSSGAVLCSYGRRRGDGNRSERVCVSYDNGDTWTDDYCVDDRAGRQGDMGYPSTIELSDGSLMTVYYACLPTDWFTSVLYTKWRLNDK